MAHTLSIEIPESLYDILVKKSHEMGWQPEALAAKWLASAAEYTAQDDPLEAFIGSMPTGVPDWTANHDKYLGEALLDDHAPGDVNR